MEEKNLQKLIRIVTRMLTDTNQEGQAKAIVFAIQTYLIAQEEPGAELAGLDAMEMEVFPVAASAEQKKLEGVDMDAINKAIDEKFQPILAALKKMQVTAEKAANLKGK